jgi:putative flippase GtrA
MWIMNVVWPVTALYFGPIAAWAYLRFGRSVRSQHKEMPGDGSASANWTQVAVATSHCGAGCALADIVTESALFAWGVTLLGSELWASYVWDFVAAWSLGIVFQYFSIKPMRHLSAREGIVAAVKADTLSILAFQIGMYGWMAITYFVLFPRPHLKPIQPEYWMMMQIGMISGFLTSYPMNRWLIETGLKEKMG